MATQVKELTDKECRELHPLNTDLSRGKGTKIKCIQHWWESSYTGLASIPKAPFSQSIRATACNQNSVYDHYPHILFNDFSLIGILFLKRDHYEFTRII